MREYARSGLPDAPLL